MKTAAHTPGPWHVQAGAHQGRIVAEALPGEAVAQVMGTDDYDANARLIASAPALLAALEACRAWIASEHPTSMGSAHSRLLERVSAAIQQARGEAS